VWLIENETTCCRGSFFGVPRRSKTIDPRHLTYDVPQQRLYPSERLFAEPEFPQRHALSTAEPKSGAGGGTPMKWFEL